MRRRSPHSSLFPYTTLFRSSTGTSSATAHRRLIGEAQLEEGDPSFRSSRIAIRSMLWQLPGRRLTDRKSTRLNSSHVRISYAVFCLKKKNMSKIDKIQT